MALPDGFQPESAVIAGQFAYLGSLGDGTIYRIDTRDGSGRVELAGQGTPAGGMKLDDSGRLFVAGGFSGTARVLDFGSGDVLATYSLASPPSLVADVIVGDSCAWFTDAFRPVLYQISFGTGGELPAPQDVHRVDLHGDIAYGQGFNVLGIERTPDGEGVLIGHCDAGLLFRVDTETGATQHVPIQGGDLSGVDGLALNGTTLIAALGGRNAVAIVELKPDGHAGEIVERIEHDGFDVPTAAFAVDGGLFVVNSKLDGREHTATTPYSCLYLSRG